MYIYIYILYQWDMRNIFNEQYDTWDYLKVG